MKSLTLLTLFTLAAIAQVAPIIPTGVDGTINVHNQDGTTTTYAYALTPTQIKGVSQFIASTTISTTSVDGKVVSLAPQYIDIADLILKNFKASVLDVVVPRYTPDPGLVQALADLTAKQAALAAANDQAALIVKTVATK